MHHRAGVKKSNRVNHRKTQRLERRAERRIERGPRPSSHIYEMPDRPTRPSFADRGYLYDEQNTAGEFKRESSEGGYGSQYQSGQSSGTYENDVYGRSNKNDEQMENSWIPSADPWRPSNESNTVAAHPTPAWRENHSGKGPKGFVRSDERIHEQVCEALTDHPEIDASQIEVEVVAGEVTLKGTVSNRAIKRLAEDVLHDLKFVKEVHNHIRSADRVKKDSH